MVYLTMLGGGVFGNDVNWILESIHKACMSVQECDLDVRTTLTLTCPLPPVQMVGGSFDAVFVLRTTGQLSLACLCMHTPQHGLAAVLTASWCCCRCAS